VTTPIGPPLLVLRPGDQVLVTLSEDLSSEEAQDLAAKLRASFPGVEFTVMTGVASVLVQPPA
jgi:hypothetical protein